MLVYSVVGERYHDNGSACLGVFSSLEAAQRYVDGLCFDYAVEFEYFDAMAFELDAPDSAVAYELQSPVFE